MKIKALLSCFAFFLVINKQTNKTLGNFHPKMNSLLVLIVCFSGCKSTKYFNHSDIFLKIF